MILYRACEEYNDEGTDVDRIYVSSYGVIKETPHTYVIITARGKKRIYKSCMGYAQLTEKDAIRAMILRRQRQIRWWKFNIRMAESALIVAEKDIQADMKG